MTSLGRYQMTSLGRYQLIETLGQGGMGTIHLAVASGLGRFRKLVVIKALRDELAFDDKFVEMFMREAALAACFSHPNVVQTVEAGYADGRYFLVMEFLDGQPLGKLLRAASRQPELPLSLRLNVLCEALLGLHYVHELRGYDNRPLHFVHRDVSPPNIFVTYDGQVKLLDFGIANARDGDGSRPGEFKGKLGYAAPEQLCGRPADRRIDVFAAGVVLWESIALRSIANGTPTRETFAARVAGTEPRIAQVVQNVEPALAHICDRAMHPEPDARYQTAEDLRTALLCYLTEREELVDASVVGQFMHEKFARARTAMHRRIDAHIRQIPEQNPRLESVATHVTGISVRPARFESFGPRMLNSPVLDARFESLSTRVTPLERPAVARSSSLALRESAELDFETRARMMRHTRRVVLRRLVAVAGLALAGAALWLAHSSRQASAELEARQRGVRAALSSGVQAVLSMTGNARDAGVLVRAKEEPPRVTSPAPERRASLTPRPQREAQPSVTPVVRSADVPPLEQAIPSRPLGAAAPAEPPAQTAQAVPLEQAVPAQEAEQTAPPEPPAQGSAAAKGDVAIPTASPAHAGAVQQTARDRPSGTLARTAPVKSPADAVARTAPARPLASAVARTAPAKPPATVGARPAPAKAPSAPTGRPHERGAPAAATPESGEAVDLHHASQRARRSLDEDNPFR